MEIQEREHNKLIKYKTEKENKQKKSTKLVSYETEKT